MLENGTWCGELFKKWMKETFLSRKKVGSKVPLTQSQGGQVKSLVHHQCLNRLSILKQGHDRLSFGGLRIVLQSSNHNFAWAIQGLPQSELGV